MKQKGDRSYVMTFQFLWSLATPLNFVSTRWTIFFINNFFYLNKVEWVSIPNNQMISDQIILVNFKVLCKYKKSQYSTPLKDEIPALLTTVGPWAQWSLNKLNDLHQLTYLTCNRTYSKAKFQCHTKSSAILLCSTTIIMACFQFWSDSTLKIPWEW